MKIFAAAIVAGAVSISFVHAQESRKAARVFSEKVDEAAQVITETLTPDADARKVPVNLTAERIDMPKRLPPGKTAFVVRNIGKEKVNFEVEGPRVRKKFRLALAPQEIKVFQMTLKPGTYQAFCTATNGKKTRIEVNLTVR